MSIFDLAKTPPSEDDIIRAAEQLEDKIKPEAFRGSARFALRIFTFLTIILMTSVYCKGVATVAPEEIYGPILLILISSMAAGLISISGDIDQRRIVEGGHAFQLLDESEATLEVIHRFSSRYPEVDRYRMQIVAQGRKFYWGDLDVMRQWHCEAEDSKQQPGEEALLEELVGAVYSSVPLSTAG